MHNAVAGHPTLAGCLSLSVHVRYYSTETHKRSLQSPGMVLSTVNVLIIDIQDHNLSRRKGEI